MLALAAIGGNWGTRRAQSGAERPPLSTAFKNVGAWRCVQNLPISEDVVKALKLDDFVFQAYRRDKGEVNLYIGYYHSAKKVGAAHDPLVCFQGQGWSVGNRQKGAYRLQKHPEFSVSYSSMVAELQGEKQVIVYWFQVNDRTTPSTHAQKLAMLMDRISGRSEDNAFVRLSAPVGSETPEATRARIFTFIDDFYPELVRYVKQMDTTRKT